MLKRIYISLLLTVAATFAMAQKNYVEMAAQYFKERNDVKAKICIDSAILNENDAKDPYTWHLRGHIYKECYLTLDSSDRNSLNRLISIESFEKSSSLDTKNEFTENNLSNIRYLLNTYRSDAVRLMDTVNYVESEVFYTTYRSLTLKYFPTTDFTRQDVEYYNAYATQVYRKYNPYAPDPEGKMFNEVLKAYEKVISFDSENCLAHYQIAIMYYNKGVDKILSMDPEASIDIMNQVLDECVALFQKSKPHMLKAWELKSCKNIDEIVEGLKGISYQLNEPEEFKKWEEEQKKLRDK